MKKEVYRAKLGRVRSNLILRIPKAVADALELNGEEVVTLKVEGRQDILIHIG